MKRVIGIDFDGVIHDSIRNSHAAFVKTLLDHNLPEVEIDYLREHFGTNWNEFFEKMGVPQDLRAQWKDKYQNNYDPIPNGSIIPDSKEVVDYLLSKYKDDVYLITNEQIDRVERFLAENNLLELRKRIHHVYSSKHDVLDELKITDYIGDSVSDGYACIKAKNKPRFICTAHNYSYNTINTLKSFYESNQKLHSIKLVNSILEVKNLL